jgi:hypothetical protein
MTEWTEHDTAEMSYQKKDAFIDIMQRLDSFKYLLEDASLRFEIKEIRMSPSKYAELCNSKILKRVPNEVLGVKIVTVYGLDTDEVLVSLKLPYGEQK